VPRPHTHHAAPRQRKRHTGRLLLLLSLLTIATVGMSLAYTRGVFRQHTVAKRQPAGHAPNTGNQADTDPVPTAMPSVMPTSLHGEFAPFAGLASGNLTTVPGAGPVVGTGGTLVRYAVDVEQGLPEDPAAFAQAVQQILGDPRSWGHGGKYRFQRVATGTVKFRVTLASPAEVDRLCSMLDTNGYTSCRQGNRSVINQNRWETAIPEWPADMATYRDYVINHEVGHTLGHGHEHCAGAGQLAPVMQQQTLNLEGCKPNGWPFP
jgi:hypothetical protein